MKKPLTMIFKSLSLLNLPTKSKTWLYSMDVYESTVPQRTTKLKGFTSKRTIPRKYASEKEIMYKNPPVFGTGNLFCTPKQVHTIIVIKLSKFTRYNWSSIFSAKTDQHKAQSQIKALMD